MAAQSISIITFEFDNPEWFPGGENKDEVDPEISFHSFITSLQTLSTTGVSPGSDVEGLLYVPDLEHADPCLNISKQYVPHNVTRQANLPEGEFARIAIAPWSSTTCAKSYLAAAFSDQVRGMIFYQPNNDSSGGPPSVTDPSWNLHDGDAWKIQNRYPVYAIDAADGGTLLTQLSLYSGNMTDVPYGHTLVQKYDSRNYIRLYCTLDTGDTPGLPNLWSFLLIVLGMLLFIIGLISFSMNFVQRRHRRQLRALIASGQVDLEALGIKRISVPQEILDKMKPFIFVADEVPDPAKANAADSQEQIAGDVMGDSKKTMATIHEEDGTKIADTSASVATASDRQAGFQSSQPSGPVVAPQDLISPSNPKLPHRLVRFSQTSCPICLEDFVSHTTVVRSLPCTHIYHPDCIDPVLRQYSSHCPLCKGKVLPVGYCPELTSSMVRRERLIRRLRERVDGEEFPGPNRRFAVGTRMASFQRQFGMFRGSSDVTIDSTQQPVSIELAPPMPATGRIQSLPAIQRPQDISRQEWATHRANELLGNRRMAEDEDRVRDAASSRFRIMMRRLFPGF